MMQLPIVDSESDLYQGTIGLLPTGSLGIVNKKRIVEWFSDCILTITTETSGNGITEFTFSGTGAVDKREVAFTMTASEAVKSIEFKATVANAFGARNRIGGLDFASVQKLTEDVKLLKRVEIPAWYGNTPLIPGVDLAEDVEYQLSKYTPAKVYDGDVEAAKECLRRCLNSHKFASLLLDVILGSPAFARWHKDDRMFIGIWGLTGTLKTTMCQIMLSCFGVGYIDDSAILKHGKIGSTIVAATTIFKMAGILPQILDNIKTVAPKDSENLVAIIQAVMEGADKARGTVDDGLRESKIFICTPILTGEIRTEEASTTARGLNLSWTRPNIDDISYVQQNIDYMPIIGYHWLRFLATTSKNLVDGYHDTLTKKTKEYAGNHIVNPGRLANIYTLMTMNWELLCEMPEFGSVFKEFTPSFKSSLDEAIAEQGTMVTEETELQKFLNGLRQLMASKKLLFEPIDTSYCQSNIVGKEQDDGNWFILPDMVLTELTKIGIFTQKPTVGSITKALYEAGMIITDGQHLKAQRSINGKRPRGWLIKKEFIEEPEDAVPEADIAAPKE